MRGRPINIRKPAKQPKRENIPRCLQSPNGAHFGQVERGRFVCIYCHTDRGAAY